MRMRDDCRPIPDLKANAWESTAWRWRCTCGAALGYGFEKSYDEVYPDTKAHADANPTHRVFLNRTQERWVVPGNNLVEPCGSECLTGAGHVKGCPLWKQGEPQ